MEPTSLNSRQYNRLELPLRILSLYALRLHASHLSSNRYKKPEGVLALTTCRTANHRCYRSQMFMFLFSERKEVTTLTSVLACHTLQTVNGNLYANYTSDPDRLAIYYVASGLLSVCTQGRKRNHDREGTEIRHIPDFPEEHTQSSSKDVATR